MFAPNSTATYNKVDVSGLIAEIMPEDILAVKPYEFYKDISRDELANFMVEKGVYVIPTTELIDYLRTLIIGSAIEIGAGNGAIGRALGIPITDNRQQELPEIKMLYESLGQAPIVYPKDVQTFDALSAVNHFKPDTVIGAFITHKWKPGMEYGNAGGVDEQRMRKKIKRYIMIGNMNTHQSKPILKHPGMFAEYHPWLITRAVNQSLNRIFIWDK